MNEEFIKYIKTYEKDEFLVSEVDSDQDFFCLISGSVGIWKGDPQQPDELVKIGEISEQGTYFGEMSVLLHEQRTASIRAKD